MFRKLLSAIAILAMSATSMSAADFYVTLNGDDANPGTEEKPFGSPEAAFLAVANAGSEHCNVYLQKDATFRIGTIRIEDGCNVDVIGDNTTFKADDNNGLNGGQGLRIMRIGKNTNVKISGVNFVNGRQTAYFAGGAIFTLGKNLEIDNCSFIDNEAGSAGGAIASRGHMLKVTNSYFKGNYTIGGGATGSVISMVGNADAENFGELYIENCAFEENKSTEGGGHGTVISIFDNCDDVKYSLTGKVSIINCTFLNNTNVQAYQADIDVSDNSDVKLYMVNNTMVNCEVGLGVYFQAEPLYLFNNFIFATKQGINSTLSSADGREPFVAASNIIIGGEAAVSDEIDDPCFKDAKYNNTLGTTANNSLASFGMSARITRDGNIGYIAIGANSPLVNKGLSNSSEYTDGVNVIPDFDCRGYVSNDGKDIGAYEYGATAPDSAVESVMDDNSDAPAVYYNLQGMQVKHPANGIFIERRGTSTRKVLIK